MQTKTKINGNMDFKLFEENSAFTSHFIRLKNHIYQRDKYQSQYVDVKLKLLQFCNINLLHVLE